MSEPLLTTAEVAEQLRKSPRFIRDEFKRGALRGVKFGGKLHFTQTDVDAYTSRPSRRMTPAEYGSYLAAQRRDRPTSEQIDAAARILASVIREKRAAAGGG